MRTTLAIPAMAQHHVTLSSYPEPPSPLRRSVRRGAELGCLGLLAVVAILLIARWLGAIYPGTVAEGERSRPYGLNQRFGYSVEQYRWRRDGFRIRLWAGGSLEMRFDVPHLDLVRVRTQRWIGGDRGILLEIDYLYRDSQVKPGELGLYYDFERGELHSYGSASAWFVWPVHSGNASKETKDEFYRAIEDSMKAPHSVQWPKPAAREGR